MKHSFVTGTARCKSYLLRPSSPILHCIRLQVENRLLSVTIAYPITRHVMLLQQLVLYVSSPFTDCIIETHRLHTAEPHSVPQSLTAYHRASQRTTEPHSVPQSLTAYHRASQTTSQRLHTGQTVGGTNISERRTPLRTSTSRHTAQGGGVRVGHAAGGSNADANEVITLCTAAQISQFNLTSLAN